MSIAIIISTHGFAAEQLLKTTEMILGKQQNISYIDFIPGENTDTLITKYKFCLNNLNTKNGVLFLVDTWGGSPFNAASRISINKNNYNVITGVNIPMLIEILMTRNDYIDIFKFTKLAVETGKIGIKSFKDLLNNNKILNNNKDELKTDYLLDKYSNVNKTNYNIDETNHMNIVLVRIDDRLIHGQVATLWTKETKVKRIIVINDDVASDQIRKTLLTQVAPPGVSAHVVNISKAIRVYNNPKYAKERVMLLFTNPGDVLRLILGGVPIKEVNIGGMAFCHGKKQINNAISVDNDDIKAFKKLNKLGIKLEVRKVSNDTPLNIMDLLKN